MKMSRQAAMWLWCRSFGDAPRATDFAGREIVKAAYNDHNSRYCWNVDHVLPRSRGGGTEAGNLICCHIRSNSEKADHFPRFTANGILFEILAVPGGYEIRPQADLPGLGSLQGRADLFSAEDGIRLFEDLVGIQGKERFCGTAFVCLKGLSTNALLDFVGKVFDAEHLSFQRAPGPHPIFLPGAAVSPQDVLVTAVRLDLLTRSEVSALLDKCVLLNTWLRHYFIVRGAARGYEIFFRLDSTDRALMPTPPEPPRAPGLGFSRCTNALYINRMALENADGRHKDERPPAQYADYLDYDLVFTRLTGELKKRAAGPH